MGTPKEMDLIRRADQLWQQAGEPAGKDDEFYHQAKNELQQALAKNRARHQFRQLSCGRCDG